MDLGALAMKAAVKNMNITETDVNQIKELIRQLTLIPSRITALEEQANRIESKLDFINH